MYKIALDVCVCVWETGGVLTSAERRLPHAASFALFIMQPSHPLNKDYANNLSATSLRHHPLGERLLLMKTVSFTSFTRSQMQLASC